MPNTSIEIDFKPMKLRAAALYPRLAAGLTALMAKEATDAEAYMRGHAPWQDQTTNARNGLTGKSSTSGSNFVIDLFHTVPYGIWLEIKWSGRYAIIVPTIQAQSPIVMSHVRNLLARI